MMTYMTDGDIWTCDVWHEWPGYIYMLWFTGMTGIYVYVVSYINDIDMWLYVD